ncbi:hypothetical protein BLNAU_5802 [Blattamonas nauphoetae]|uniref:Ensconsin n=1 Tax=Blattamonas nauphoetae TaxID=2049346 RepID=A0ABQ9Y6G1_9EUKA|nr:hypothetical protein BLNAU_5802 [Blattamonas nauphoetae]
MISISHLPPPPPPLSLKSHSVGHTIGATPSQVLSVSRPPSSYSLHQNPRSLSDEELDLLIAERISRNRNAAFTPLPPSQPPMVRQSYPLIENLPPRPPFPSSIQTSITPTNRISYDASYSNFDQPDEDKSPTDHGRTPYALATPQQIAPSPARKPRWDGEPIILTSQPMSARSNTFRTSLPDRNSYPRHLQENWRSVYERSAQLLGRDVETESNQYNQPEVPTSRHQISTHHSADIPSSRLYRPSSLEEFEQKSERNHSDRYQRQEPRHAPIYEQESFHSSLSRRDEITRPVPDQSFVEGSIMPDLKQTEALKPRHRQEFQDSISTTKNASRREERETISKPAGKQYVRDDDRLQRIRDDREKRRIEEERLKREKDEQYQRQKEKDEKERLRREVEAELERKEEEIRKQRMELEKKRHAPPPVHHSPPPPEDSEPSQSESDHFEEDERSDSSSDDSGSRWNLDQRSTSQRSPLNRLSGTRGSSTSERGVSSLASSLDEKRSYRSPILSKETQRMELSEELSDQSDDISEDSIDELLGELGPQFQKRKALPHQSQEMESLGSSWADDRISTKLGRGSATDRYTTNRYQTQPSESPPQTQQKAQPPKQPSRISFVSDLKPERNILRQSQPPTRLSQPTQLLTSTPHKPSALTPPRTLVVRSVSASSKTRDTPLHSSHTLRTPVARQKLSAKDEILAEIEEEQRKKEEEAKMKEELERRARTEEARIQAQRRAAERTRLMKEKIKKEEEERQWKENEKWRRRDADLKRFQQQKEFEKKLVEQEKELNRLRRADERRKREEEKRKEEERKAKRDEEKQRQEEERRRKEEEERKQEALRQQEEAKRAAEAERKQRLHVKDNAAQNEHTTPGKTPRRLVARAGLQRTTAPKASAQAQKEQEQETERRPVPQEESSTSRLAPPTTQSRSIPAPTQRQTARSTVGGFRRPTKEASSPPPPESAPSTQSKSEELPKPATTPRSRVPLRRATTPTPKRQTGTAARTVKPPPEPEPKKEAMGRKHVALTTAKSIHMSIGNSISSQELENMRLSVFGSGNENPAPAEVPPKQTVSSLPTPPAVTQKPVEPVKSTIPETRSQIPTFPAKSQPTAQQSHSPVRTSPQPNPVQAKPVVESPQSKLHDTLGSSSLLSDSLELEFFMRLERAQNYQG